MRAALDPAQALASAAALTDVVVRPAALAMAFLAPGQPHETIAVPGVALAAHDVLIAVEMTTICECDVQIVQGWRGAPTPLVLGHESVGRVIALGGSGADPVDGSPLRLGDRVVWSQAVPCGACDRCRAGSMHECVMPAAYGHDRIAAHRELTGGFASHMHLRAGTAIVRAPEALPAAALAPASCTTATAWAAVAHATRLRELDGARLRIRGAGLLGLTVCAIATEHGARVDVVDDDPLRRARAVRFGASAEAHGAPDIVIDTTPGAGGQAFAELARGGAAVEAAHGSTAADLSAAVAFLAASGRAYPFADAVGTVLPLADLDRALREAGNPAAPLRVGVVAR